MGPSAGGNFYAAEHPGKFLDAIFRTELSNIGSSRFAVGELDDAVVVPSLARDLGEMSHAQDLSVRCEFGQATSYDLRDATADARVDFIEDHGRNGSRPGTHDLQRQADT